jgi:hypothetical protein
MKRKKKEEIPFIEIRIVRPSKKVFETVKKLAEKEDRTISKQAENMLKQFIELSKL